MNQRSLFTMCRPVLLAVGTLAFLLPTVAWSQARVTTELYTGTPFGVGRVTIQNGNGIGLKQIPMPGNGRILDLARRGLEATVLNPQETVHLQSAELSLTEKSGRIYYPVFEKRDRPILSEFVSLPNQATILFLFQGDAPLELTAYAPQPSGGRATPTRDPAGYDRLMRAWWRDYAAAADSRARLQDVPPMVEEYLVDMLSRRLKQQLPARAATSDSSLFQAQLNLLMGTDTARLEMARKILLGEVSTGQATEPLPEELPRPKLELLNPPDKQQIEPIALHVPVECFYVRFGSFSNFLWMRKRMDDWGGELRDVISERGLDLGLNNRMQRQIGLKESELAKVMGDNIVADVALLGCDTFLGEGATIGMLFQAKNNLLLAGNLTSQRLAAFKEAKNAKQSTVPIAGRQVSLISTPENVLRSFQVSDGDYHLVTNSQTLVEWFLATGAKRHDSLGASEAFNLARSRMPLARNDAIFAYLSPEFFGNLMSPRYQIELNRRLRSAVEIELVRIARLAAQGERKPAATIDDLVKGGYLPTGFGQHADGSTLELVGNEMVDSVRGARGTFLPTADAAIDRITPQERADYVKLSETYTTDWGTMDPVVAGIGRTVLPEGGFERVTLDVQSVALSEKHTKMLAEWLGPPTDLKLAPVPGNVVSFEANLRGGSYFSGGDHHLFGALRDADPTIALDPRSGLLAKVVTGQLEGLSGYLGAWPNPGYLNLIGGLSDLQRDPRGYSKSLTGVWRRQFNDFTLLSFRPELLEQVSPQLQFERAARPAQAWLHADDLSQSKLAPLFNAYGYRQSREIIKSNTRFMNMLSEQLHVPQKDALVVAEQILQAKLVAPLGGNYELRELPGGMQTWTSSSLTNQPNPDKVPADYTFPALTWLRGIDLELRFDAGLLALHGEVIMPADTTLQPTGGGFTMPSLFGGNKTVDAPPAQAPRVEPPRPGPGTRDF